MSTDLFTYDRPVRTQIYCHSCESKKLSPNFIAKIDYRLDGNHEIECPRCGHIHYRLVKQGKVTSERYHTDHETHKVAKRDMWKSTTQPIQTSGASVFIRERWLGF